MTGGLIPPPRAGRASVPASGLRLAPPSGLTTQPARERAEEGVGPDRSPPSDPSPSLRPTARLGARSSDDAGYRGSVARRRPATPTCALVLGRHAPVPRLRSKPPARDGGRGRRDLDGDEIARMGGRLHA